MIDITLFECFKLFALMISPLIFSLIVGGIWEGIEYRRAERKQNTGENYGR